MPSANGVGTARSVAIAYGEFAAGGDRLGIDAGTLAALRQPAAPPSSGTFDEVLRIAREAGVSVHISHIKALGYVVWGRTVDRHRKTGIAPRRWPSRLR